MKAIAIRSATTPAPADPHGLTLAQQNAVDLLAGGKNDTETAKALGLNRVTVTRWRLYSPEFRAALADRRAAVWGASADRLRALLPRAIDTLAEALGRPGQVKTALAVLKLAGSLPPPPSEPTDPDEVVRRTVDAERQHARERDDDFDELSGLPGYDDHVKAVRNRLARLAAPRGDEA
jgi:hypothetical protein